MIFDLHNLYNCKKCKFIKKEKCICKQGELLKLDSNQLFGYDYDNQKEYMTCGYFEAKKNAKEPYTIQIQKEYYLKKMFLILAKDIFNIDDNLYELDITDFLDKKYYSILHKSLEYNSGYADVSINIFSKNKLYAGICFEFKKDIKIKMRDSQINIAKSLFKQHRITFKVADYIDALMILDKYLNDDSFNFFDIDNQYYKDYIN